MSQSVGKALQILGQLGTGPANLDQLAAALDVHKTTVLRLLRTLAEQHFVFRDGSNRYHLGARIHELSSRGLEQREVRPRGPHLFAFNRGTCAHDLSAGCTEVVYITSWSPHDHVRWRRDRAAAPRCTHAAGKVLLAPCAASWGARPSRVPRITPNTITTGRLRQSHRREQGVTRPMRTSRRSTASAPRAQRVGRAGRGACRCPTSGRLRICRLCRALESPNASRATALAAGDHPGTRGLPA